MWFRSPCIFPLESHHSFHHYRSPNIPIAFHSCWCVRFHSSFVTSLSNIIAHTLSQHVFCEGITSSHGSTAFSFSLRFFPILGAIFAPSFIITSLPIANIFGQCSFITKTNYF